MAVHDTLIMIAENGISELAVVFVSPSIGRSSRRISRMKSCKGPGLMLRKNRLFTPGPTPLLPAAQFAEASFTAHHRTADFRNLFTRVLADMKEFIGTQNDVLVLACSGTGVMEAAVSNLTSPGDKMLVLTAGKFGERWTALGKAYGCQVEILSKPYGETFSL